MQARILGRSSWRKAAGGSRLAGFGSALGRALLLWQGPPLADFRYEPFARVEIARLEELHLMCLEERIEADLALGDGWPGASRNGELTACAAGARR